MNQPFLLGQVFSYSFKLFGKDFWKMFLTIIVTMFIVLIPAVVMIVSIVINPAFFKSIDTQALMNNPFSAFPTSMIIMYVVLFIIALLASPYMAGIVLLLSSSRMKGKPLSFKEAFMAVTQKYGRLLATVLCSALLALPLIALYLVVYFGFFNSLSGFASGDFNMSGFGSAFAMMPLMFLLNMVYEAAMILLGIAFNYALCATVNEEVYAFPAVFKGFRLLFKGGFWRSIGHFIVMALALAGAGIVFAILVALLAIPAAFAAMISPAIVIIFVLLILAFTGCIYPFELTYLQLMYFNARLKAEGTMFGLSAISDEPSSV
jgi:hypothetical protein